MSGSAVAATVQPPVHETTLSNGLKVLIQEVHTAPVVSFMVWYKVGSRNESAGITGISHLLEHMMFKGTPTYGKGEIARILQRNGASFNAGTSLDYTNYYEVLASDRLDLAIQIEADRMRNALIPDEEHRLEMTVVRSELERNEDNPHRALYLETFAQAFKAHPYHWPTIGWRTDVEQIKTEQIRDYYRRYYVPNNATVVIAGDVDRSKVLASVERAFGSIPKGPEPPEVKIVEPPQIGERRFKIRKPGDTRYLMVAWRNPALTDPDTYPLDVLGMILGHGKTSRLYRALVEGKLATDVDASNETARDPFLLIAQATVAPGATLDGVEAELYREVEKLKNKPVAPEELARAKRQVQASFVYAKDSIRSLAQQLGYFETVASYKYLNTYLDKIAAVTPEALQRVARKYLTEDTRTVGWYEPLPPDSALGDSGGGGQAERFASGVRGEANHAFGELSAGPPVHAYRDESAEADAPISLGAAAGGRSAAGVIASPHAEGRSPVRRVLPNGLTLIVRENHANPTIALQGIVKAGGIFDPPGKSGLATFVGMMLDQGTKSRSAFEQATTIESLGASLRFDGGLETLSLSGNLLSGDLEEILRVLADALRNPAFPAEQVEKMRDELIIDYRVAENSTASVAARRANELLYPEGHPYHWSTGGSDTSLAAITREDLASFHARHYGPNTTILVLVGDVTESRAAALVEKVFGDWKKLPDPPAFQVPNADPPKEVRDLVVPKPGKSQADVVWAVPGLPRSAPDYDAAMMMNYVLGGGSLSSRLMDNLRDKEGLVYGAYSSMVSGIGAGPIQIRAGTNPGNVDRTIEALLGQVGRFHDEGPTDEEMEAAKGFLTGIFPVRLEANAGVAGQLLSAELYGLGLDYIERYPSIVRAVTTADAKAAARKYLSRAVYVLVVAGSYESAKGHPVGK
jgi:zinc protease